MTGPVAAGVVGVGKLGREHVRVLSELPGAELVGVHDVDTARGEEVAAGAGTRHASSLGELAARAEALVVAVPTGRHHGVASRALAAGCHVLVEKPLAETLAEADELIAAAEEGGLQLGVGHVERFNRAVRSCRPHLRSPRFIESLRLAPFQPRGTDVTVVLDLMIHDIDLVLGLVDAPLASLHAVGTPVLTGQIDIANARLVFEDGAVAEITASRVSEEGTRVLRLFQNDGYIRLDLAEGRGEFLRRRDGGEPDGAPSSLADLVERVPLGGGGPEPLRLELESFLDAVRGRESAMVSGREGRAALEIALGITREIERFNDVALEAQGRA